MVYIVETFMLEFILSIGCSVKSASQNSISTIYNYMITPFLLKNQKFPSLVVWLTFQMKHLSYFVIYIYWCICAMQNFLLHCCLHKSKLIKAGWITCILINDITELAKWNSKNEHLFCVWCWNEISYFITSTFSPLGTESWNSHFTYEGIELLY